MQFTVSENVSKLVAKNTYLVFLIFVFSRVSSLVPQAFKQLVAMAVFAFIVGIFLTFWRFPFRIVGVLKKPFLLVSLYILLEMVALTVGLIYGSVSPIAFCKQFLWILTISIFMFRSLSDIKSNRDFSFFVKRIFYILAIFYIINISLSFLGFKGALDQAHAFVMESATFRALGIYLPVMNFPLSGGIRGSAVPAVFLVVGSLVFIKHEKAHKLLHIFFLLLGLFVILAADSRTALICSILLSMPIFFLTDGNRILKTAKFAVLLLPVFPVLLLILASVMSSSDAALVLSRGDGAINISTLSNRSVIWGATTEYIQRPSWTHIIGNGTNGQIRSGIESQYEFLFDKRLDQETTHSLHNYLLQVFVDQGFIGVLVFLLLCYSIISRVLIYHSAENLFLFYSLIGLLFMSLTTIAPKAPADAFSFFLILAWLHTSTHIHQGRNPPVSA